MQQLPDPTTEAVGIWLKNGLTRDHIHNQGWQEANRRFHGIARAARPYIQANYKTPEEQEAAFDGLTLALLTLAHFNDIQQLDKLICGSSGTASAADQQKQVSDKK